MLQKHCRRLRPVYIVGINVNASADKNDLKSLQNTLSNNTSGQVASFQILGTATLKLWHTVYRQSTAHDWGRENIWGALTILWTVILRFRLIIRFPCFNLWSQFSDFLAKWHSDCHISHFCQFFSETKVEVIENRTFYYKNYGQARSSQRRPVTLVKFWPNSQTSPSP